MSGSLRFTVGRASFVVGPGDCVAARVDRPTRLEALGAEPAEYLVIVERRDAMTGSIRVRAVARRRSTTSLRVRLREILDRLGATTARRSASSTRSTRRTPTRTGAASSVRSPSDACVAARAPSRPTAAVAGTVQLDVDTLPNQPHRATVSKLLVHSAARAPRRRRGADGASSSASPSTDGRWLLTLDTATEDAARLYRRMGWSLAGVIPDYALNADGTLTDTAFYWKRLR